MDEVLNFAVDVDVRNLDWPLILATMINDKGKSGLKARGALRTLIEFDSVGLFPDNLIYWAVAAGNTEKVSEILGL